MHFRHRFKRWSRFKCYCLLGLFALRLILFLVLWPLVVSPLNLWPWRSSSSPSSSLVSSVSSLWSTLFTLVIRGCNSACNLSNPSEPRAFSVAHFPFPGLTFSPKVFWEFECSFTSATAWGDMMNHAVKPCSHLNLQLAVPQNERCLW